MNFFWQRVSGFALLLLAGCSAESAKEHNGAAVHEGLEVYRRHCIECHGENGGGNALEEVDALYGQRSVAALTRFIERNMPEEDPSLCVGKEAEAVAEYIYDAFYSAEARKRLGLEERAKVQMARLTEIQYRNVVADLVACLDSPGLKKGLGESGLKGYYFNSQGMNKKQGKSTDRLDVILDFDFGEKGPVEGVKSEQFSIVWEGSFFARETGYYEFRTSTPNGVRLYVNTALRADERNYRDDSSKASRKALIDDWVSSGPEIRQSTERVFLLGGRRYPLRMDYFKYKEKIGKVKLEWKTPHGTWEVFGGDQVYPVIVPRTFVISATFPPDDHSQGYGRGNLVSKSWHEGITAGAIQTTGEIVQRLDEFVKLTKDDAQRRQALKEFCVRFTETAFRRPLTEKQKEFFVYRHFSGVEDLKIAVKRSILLCLKSPRFLYPELSVNEGKPDAYTIASRLSFALWDSIPDERLLEAARSGNLLKAGQVEIEASKMLEDPRARAKMNMFFEHWLEMDGRDPAKDRLVFPDFSDEVIMDLRESLLRFVNEVVWSQDSDYRQLLKAEHLLLNERLGSIYGGNVKGTSLRSVTLKQGQRAGILTHPYLLSLFAYHDNTSPIHRGVFLTRNILGRMIKPPPDAVSFDDEKLDPSLTMREKITQLTSANACMSCHSVINPLGFSLENYDAIGRWRISEQDKKINPESDYMTAAGELLTFAGPKDIAEFAVRSPAAHNAFVNAVFTHLAKQPVAAYGTNSLIDLRKGFTASLFSIKALMVECAKLYALRGYGAQSAAVSQPAG